MKKSRFLKVLSVFAFCGLVCVSYSLAAEKHSKDAGLKSGITRPEKLSPISRPDGVSKGIENVSGGITKPAGDENKLRLSDLKEKKVAPKDGTAAAKENLQEKSAAYKAKAEELRAKLLKGKTGEQKSNFEKLASDAEAIKSGSSVTAEMKKKFTEDLCSILSTAGAPSSGTVEKFASDLSAAVADRKIGAREAAQLSQDIAAILGSANISDEDAAALKNDALQIVEAAGISTEEKEALKGDIESIAEFATANAQKLKTASESGAAGAAKSDLETAKSRVKEVKERKNSIRERIKEIKKNGNKY